MCGGKYKVNIQNGWFVPSRYEWDVFISAMSQGNLKSEVTSYSDLGLSGRYWSSSQWATTKWKYYAYATSLYYKKTEDLNVDFKGSVRLATTY